MIVCDDTVYRRIRNDPSGPQEALRSVDAAEAKNGQGQPPVALPIRSPPVELQTAPGLKLNAGGTVQITRQLSQCGWNLYARAVWMSVKQQSH